MDLLLLSLLHFHTKPIFFLAKAEEKAWFILPIGISPNDLGGHFDPVVHL